MALLYLAPSGDVRLSLGSPAEAEISAPQIELGNRRATNLINGYLEKAYPSQIPFTASGDIPALVETIAIDLATYFVKRDTHPGPNPLSDEVKADYYDKNIEILKEIRDGSTKIPELEGKQGANIISNRGDYSPIFDVDSVEKHVVDPDLSDKIADDRD